MVKVLWWLKQVVIALDQFVNTLLGGWADETISSRAHRLYKARHPAGLMRYLINWIFFWQVDHCLEAYSSERHDRHLPPELRNTIEA